MSTRNLYIYYKMDHCLTFFLSSTLMALASFRKMAFPHKSSWSTRRGIKTHSQSSHLLQNRFKFTSVIFDLFNCNAVHLISFIPTASTGHLWWLSECSCPVFLLTREHPTPKARLATASRWGLHSTLTRGLFPPTPWAETQSPLKLSYEKWNQWPLT